MIKSYPKIWNVGHGAVTDLFEGEVTIEEKLDGSQFSFGVFEGVIKIRSKSVDMDVHGPEAMFNKAAATVLELAPLLKDGWTYRAEYLSKPKHNTLAYARTPSKFLMVFDINTGHEQFLSYEEKQTECERIGLEVVPLIYKGSVDSADKVKELMDRISVLGLQKIEGIVIKNYAKFGPDKKTLMGKHVSEEFKEVHRQDWKERHPGHTDIIDQIIDSLKTQPRWEKAIQHLKEQGKITNSPKDIGLLMTEIRKDTIHEEQAFINEKLYKWAIGKIERGITKDLPRWYKERLLATQFED